MLEFIRAGGVFMIPLILTSIIALAFVIERGLALRWKTVIPGRVQHAVENCLAPEHQAELRYACEQNPSPLSRLLLVALNHLARPREETTEAIQTKARYEVLQLERGLVILEIVVGIAPLLGLVGAIYGLITLFSGLGQSGPLENVVVARGIAEALNTTLTGLIIAIPALIAWSYYNKKVEVLTVEMETICDEFVRRLYRMQKRENA